MPDELGCRETQGTARSRVGFFVPCSDRLADDEPPGHIIKRVDVARAPRPLVAALLSFLFAQIAKVFTTWYVVCLVLSRTCCGCCDGRRLRATRRRRPRIEADSLSLSLFPFDRRHPFSFCARARTPQVPRQEVGPDPSRGLGRDALVALGFRKWRTTTTTTRTTKTSLSCADLSGSSHLHLQVVGLCTAVGFASGTSSVEFAVCFVFSAIVSGVHSPPHTHTHPSFPRPPRV